MSAEPAGYDGGACYLAEAPPRGLGAARARHASDGDILAPPHRPESGAFSGEGIAYEADHAEA